MRGSTDDTLRQVFLRDASTRSEHTPSTASAVGVHGYTIGAVEVEGLAMPREAKDRHTLALGLGEVNGVVNTLRCTVVVGRYEGLVLVRRLCSSAQTDEPTIFGDRGRCPACIGVLEVATDLTTCELHSVEEVGEGAELKEVTHIDLASGEDGGGLQRCGKGDLCIHRLELHTMDDVHIGCRTEEGIFTTHLGGQLTDFGSQIVIHCSVLLGEVAEEDRVRLYTLE